MPERMGGQFGQVLEAAQAGAGWAAERLWRSLAPAVAGYLRVQGASRARRRDQRGVHRGVPQPGLVLGRRGAVPLLGVHHAHRRLTDDRRRAGRRPAPSPFGEESRGPSSADSAESEALRRLSEERVRAVCDRLVPDQRDVLLLRLVGGLTSEEVAAALGKSPGAVRALQRRASAALRRIFDREGVPL
ncbi:MAG: sigma factor-like helix-turn-helix DNA-binding protein [Acidimicrobiales bacterium]